MAQVAYKYTWTLPRLHGLDNYSLGMNLNWYGHKSGLDKISCSINFAHFSGVKNHFLSPYISHMSSFLYPWTVFRAKKHLLCELFSSSLPPSSTQKCLSWAVSPQASSGCLCTTGNRHTVRRRHPTHCSNADVSCFSEIIFCGYFYMIFNALLLLLCSGGQFALRWQIYLNIKMHGSFTCFTYPWKTLSHFIISSVLVFCNGLTPFYGYALRTFFTRKKGLGMLHVVFHGNSATYHCC